jgi:prevent-host-death family protein
MEQVNIHEAKTNLSRLVHKAAAGEPFIIAIAGKPMVKVIPLAETVRQGKRGYDSLKGQFQIPGDFDRMFSQEIQELFEGSDENPAR